VYIVNILQATIYWSKIMKSVIYVLTRLRHHIYVYFSCLYQGIYCGFCFSFLVHVRSAWYIYSQRAILAN